MWLSVVNSHLSPLSEAQNDILRTGNVSLEFNKVIADKDTLTMTWGPQTLQFSNILLRVFSNLTSFGEVYTVFFSFFFTPTDSRGRNVFHRQPLCRLHMLIFCQQMYCQAFSDKWNTIWLSNYPPGSSAFPPYSLIPPFTPPVSPSLLFINPNVPALCLGNIAADCPSKEWGELLKKIYNCPCRWHCCHHYLPFCL